MSGINTVSESIKKKLTLKDYKPATLQDIDTLEPFEGNTAGRLEGENASQLKSVEAHTSTQGERAIIGREEVKALTPQHTNTSDHYPSVAEQELRGIDAETSKSKEVKTSKLTKTTIYLTEEANQMLNEIYARRILSNNKGNKYDIFCEAIELLHQKEKIK